MKTFSLLDKMMALRVSASAIYDKAQLEGLKQEEIQKTIEPLNKALHELIDGAAKSENLKQCIVAINGFEELSKAREQEAKFLIEKAYEAKSYSDLIRHKLAHHMKAKGLTELRNDDFWAVLTEHEGKMSITLR